MSATIAGAMKAALEGQGLGLAFYRDEAPPGAPMPYGVLTELPAVAEGSGDYGDPDGEPAEVRQQVQVDVWQAARTDQGEVAENYTLGARTYRALRGMRLVETVGLGRAYPLVPRTWQRIGPGSPLSGDNLVRDLITVEVVRTLGAP